MIYRPFVLEDGPKICAWRYGGAYAIYNLPPFEEIQKQNLGFGAPEKAVNYLVFCEGEDVLGFVNLLDEGEQVFLGIGVAPERCGQGLGQQMIKDAMTVARQRHGEKPVYLEVRTWNARAIACYQQAGFQITGQIRETTCIGDGEFYVMHYHGVTPA